MRKAAGWVIFLAIGIILLVAGARGRVGSALGAIITPSAMQDVKS